MRTRAIAQGLAVVAAVALLAFLAVRLLSDDGGGTSAPPDELDTPAEEEESARPFTIEQMSDAQKARSRHNNPWPFGSFSDDIAALLQPGRREVMEARDDAERVIVEKIQEHRFTIRLDDVRVGDVVRTLEAEFAPLGIEVYEGSPKVSDRVVFERLYLTDVTIQQVISAMTAQSRDLVFSAITPLGICVGSKNACVQARLDAKEWEADIRAKIRTDPDEFLDVEYRPDVRGANIGRLLRDIQTKTDVEVVVDERAWNTGVTFTWVADPLPLRDALDTIARRLGARVYVKDGRAFLLVV